MAASGSGGQEKADRDGQHLGVALARAFRINADGKFSEYWALADDQDELKVFWS